MSPGALQYRPSAAAGEPASAPRLHAGLACRAKPPGRQPRKAPEKLASHCAIGIFLPRTRNRRSAMADRRYRLDTSTDATSKATSAANRATSYLHDDEIASSTENTAFFAPGYPDSIVRNTVEEKPQRDLQCENSEANQAARRFLCCVQESTRLTSFTSTKHRVSRVRRNS